MEHEDLVSLCKSIKDEIEPVRNRMAYPVRGRDYEDLHVVKDVGGYGE
jgi:hypothetical protein